VLSEQAQSLVTAVRLMALILGVIAMVILAVGLWMIF